MTIAIDVATDRLPDAAVLLRDLGLSDLGPVPRTPAARPARLGRGRAGWSGSRTEGDDPMTRLSDTRPSFSPPPPNGPTAMSCRCRARCAVAPPTKVVGALLTRGLIREQVTASVAKADAAMNTIWRNEPDGRGVLLLVTAAGLQAIGIEPADATSAPEVADDAPVEAAPGKRSRTKKASPTDADAASAPKTRDGTKQAQVIAMLRSKQGATIARDHRGHGMEAAHGSRLFRRALKKKLGLDAHLREGRGRGASTGSRPPDADSLDQRWPPSPRGGGRSFGARASGSPRTPAAGRRSARC